MIERRKRSPIQKKRQKKKALHNEKRDMQVLLLAAVCLSVSEVPLPGFAVFLFTSTSGMSVRVPGLLALLSVLFVFCVSVPVLGSLAPPSLSFQAGVFVPMPKLSTFLFVLSVADISVPVPGLSAPPFVSSVSDMSVLMPGSSTLPGLSSPLFLI